MNHIFYQYRINIHLNDLTSDIDFTIQLGYVVIATNDLPYYFEDKKVKSWITTTRLSFFLKKLLIKIITAINGFLSFIFSKRAKSVVAAMSVPNQIKDLNWYRKLKNV